MRFCVWFFRVFCKCCNHLDEEEREGKLVYLFVFIHILNTGEVDTVKHV